jgi:uncharacterized membrane protein YdjX (TVP38/TMEM64 family)
MKTTYASLLVIILLFVAASYVVQTNIGFLEATIGNSPFGMSVYVLVAIIGTVIAPVNSLPLLPIAVGLWGPNTAAVLSIFGWFIGAGIDYELARRFGKNLVKKIVSVEKIEKFSAKVSGNYSFIRLLMLRLLLPVDILSYALGLFTLVGRKMYYATTAIGIIPFAFIWAYLGSLHYGYQAGAFLGLGLLFYIGYTARKWWHRK